VCAPLSRHQGTGEGRQGRVGAPISREVVNYLRDSEEFVPALLPVGDGLAVAVKR